MIVFSCARVPKHTSLPALTEKLRQAFVSGENEEYFREILQSENEDSVRERVTALLSLAFLLEELGVSKESRQALILKRADCGKPYFECSDISFSLSHSRGCVAAVVSDEGEVGIDIECSSVSDARAERISSRFFPKAISSAPINTNEFLREWTRCEAAAKLRGLPLAEYLKCKREGSPQGDEGIRYFEYTAYGHPVTVCTYSTASEIKKAASPFADPAKRK